MLHWTMVDIYVYKKEKRKRGKRKKEEETSRVMKPVEKRKTYCQSCIWFQWHCKYIHSKNCAPTANSASDPVDIATERKRMHTDCLTTHLRLYTSMLWSTQYSSHIQLLKREFIVSSALSSCHNNCQQSRVYLCGDDFVMLLSFFPSFLYSVHWMKPFWC